MSPLVSKSAAATATSPSTPRGPGRLDTLPRCRREAVRLYSDGRRGLITPADCSKLASALNLVASLIERGELEDRVAALEEAAP
jgi:hypothetical protein